MKRRLVILCLIAASLFLLASLAIGAVLAWWVPTRGKARLIELLERPGVLQVSIGAVRYRLFQGIQLDQVRIVKRASQELWLSAPHAQVRIGWPSLVLLRRVAFHAEAPIDGPCRTTLTVSGHYHLSSQSLAMTAQTTDVPLDAVAPPLADAIPPSLTSGSLRLTLRYLRTPQRPPELSGRLLGRQLVWDTPSLRLRGELTYDGLIVPPAGQDLPWTLRGHLALRDATLKTMRPPLDITQLEGEGHIMDDRLDVDRLTGQALGSEWTLEGTLSTVRTMPRLEALVRSRVDAASLVDAFPAVAERWKPSGRPELRAVCRGPLKPAPMLDCLLHAELTDVRLEGAMLATPVTNLAGSLDYDVFEKRLTVNRLDSTVAGQRLAARGEVLLAAKPLVSGRITGTLPLAMLEPWLPAQRPVAELGGLADVDLELNGRMPSLKPVGRVELRSARARLVTLAKPLTDLNGAVVLHPERIDLERLALLVEEQPLTVMGAITPGDPHTKDFGVGARVAATVELPAGTVTLNGRLSAEAFVIEEGRIALARSRLRARGAIARAAQAPSTLVLEGLVELSELPTLPFVSVPWVTAWNLRGPVEVRAEARGQPRDLGGAALRAELRAERVTVRDVPIERLSCALEQGERMLHLRIPSAVIADGKFWATLDLYHRARNPEYVLEADVVGLQLATLSRLIPAWRTRSPSGSASAHAQLVGTWAARPTWRGDGWINATGERLGDVPLLDKVFRGLFGVLADRLGLEILRRAQITQASFRWRLSQERVLTDDFRLGGMAGEESVAVYAKGSVGLDQTLDFVVEPELSEGVLMRAPTTATLAGTVLKAAGQLERLRRLIGRHRLTGTLKEPHYRFEFSTQELFKQLVPGPADFFQNLLDRMR